uniref:Flavin-containing monooxygenase n=1 Tax=Panagrolaimus sp. JU765 TaxID=591449 RepID=A0AC34R4I8_9BILA
MEDYTGYMNNLASKIGVKPSVCSFLTSPKFGLKCVFGPNLPYQYRLRGEHTWDDARNAIMTSDQRIRTPPSNRYFKRWQLDVILLCCL